jgi:hypothetical protein
MAGRQRTTFAKLQRERARQEKQAQKRARRQGDEPMMPVRHDGDEPIIDSPYGLYPDELVEAQAAATAASEAGEAPPEGTDPAPSDSDADAPTVGTP